MNNGTHPLAGLTFRRWYRMPSAVIPSVLLSLASATVFFMPAEKRAMMESAFKLVLPLTVLLLHGSFGQSEFLAEHNLRLLVQERGQIRRWVLSFTAVHVAIGTLLILPVLITGCIIEPQQPWLRIALVLELTNIFFVLEVCSLAVLLFKARSEVVRNLVFVFAYFGVSTTCLVGIVALCLFSVDLNRTLGAVAITLAAAVAALFVFVLLKTATIPRRMHIEQARGGTRGS